MCPTQSVPLLHYDDATGLVYGSGPKYGQKGQTERDRRRDDSRPTLDSTRPRERGPLHRPPTFVDFLAILSALALTRWMWTHDPKVQMPLVPAPLDDLPTPCSTSGQTRTLRPAHSNPLSGLWTSRSGPPGSPGPSERTLRRHPPAPTASRTLPHRDPAPTATHPPARLRPATRSADRPAEATLAVVEGHGEGVARAPPPPAAEDVSRREGHGHASTVPLRRP